MPLAISPRHNLEEYPNGIQNLDDKIEIFIDRVEYWQLGVAKAVIDQDIGYRGYALLSLVISYFEMIAKYSVIPNKLVKGEWKPKSNGDFFREGANMVIGNVPVDEQHVIEALYKRVRNGIYHIGLTTGGVILSGDFPEPLGWNDSHQLLGINPDKLVQLLIDDFKACSTALRNPNNTELRQRFEARFDSDNK